MTDSESPGAAHGGASAGDDGLARLTEEIRLLVEMVVEQALPWLEQVLARGHGGADQEEADQRSGCEPNATCDWCPLCAVASIARGQSPEFVVRLFEQAAQVIALLRAVLADRWQPDDGVHMPGFTPAAKPGQQRDSDRVQHIVVRRSPDWE